MPGFAALQRMATILLAKRAPDAARVLVPGAGGGLELQAMAQVQPGGTFVGVGPSAEMLRLAERTPGTAGIARAPAHEPHRDRA